MWTHNSKVNANTYVINCEDLYTTIQWQVGLHARCNSVTAYNIWSDRAQNWYNAITTKPIYPIVLPVNTYSYLLLDEFSIDFFETVLLKNFDQIVTHDQVVEHVYTCLLMLQK